MLVQQQVVAFGHDDRSVGRDGDPGRDRFLDVAEERRRVHPVLVGCPQSPKKSDVPGDVEGAWGPLAIASSQRLEYGVAEMDTVHWDQHRLVTELADECLGDGALAGAGRSGDA